MQDQREPRVQLTLSAAEGLVLFEWVSRLNDADLDAHFEDPAERSALWSLQSLLEEELVAPFQADYREQVERAREEIQKAYGLKAPRP